MRPALDQALAARRRRHRDGAAAFLSQSGARAAGAAAIGQWAPELPVFCSSDVWPIIREYERTATATINGYVQPRSRLSRRPCRAACARPASRAEPMVTKSNGGVMTRRARQVAPASRCCCRARPPASSAPAYVAAPGRASTTCMSLDIGGTSADVAIIVDGTAAPTASGEKIGDFPIYIPTVSVSSIGDGGGSIAWVDEFGVLKVGPESAGSTPGPACYGRGGTRPTMTDAFAVCGFLGHARPRLRRGLPSTSTQARAAVGTLAAAARARARTAAEAIIQVAVSGMYREVEQARLAPGHRPARLHPAGVRRRRTDAGLLPGARARHAARS